MKNKPYKIPQLPFGWHVSELSMRLMDTASIADDDGTEEVHIKVGFEDNGVGHFLKLQFVNGKDEPINKFDIEADTLRDIGSFCDALVQMIDHSAERAFDETKEIWESNIKNIPDRVDSGT